MAAILTFFFGLNARVILTLIALAIAFPFVMQLYLLTYVPSTEMGLVEKVNIWANLLIRYLEHAIPGAVGEALGAALGRFFRQFFVDDE